MAKQKKSGMKRFLFWATIIFLVFIAGIFFLLDHALDKIDDVTVTAEDVQTALTADEILSDPYSGFSNLAEDEQQAYLRIQKEIEALSDTFYMDGNPITVDQLDRIWFALVQDHPEYFWLDEYEYTYSTIDNQIESITLNNSMTDEEIEQNKQALESWADTVLAGIAENADDYEKALYLHDYIIDHTAYVEDAKNNQNVLSVVEGESVCAGYAKAYQYLLNRAGIFATLAQGKTYEGVAHAWNLVKLGEEYGWMDLTWDDPSFDDDGFDYKSYVYFGLGTDGMNKTHTFDTTLMAEPVFSEPSWNYFTVEGLDFDTNSSGDLNRLIQKIEEAAAQGSDDLTVRVQDRSQIDTLLTEISQNSVSEEYALRYVADEMYPVIMFLF